MNKLKNNAWFRKAGMALLDIVLIVLSVYLSMELRFEMYIPSRHMETMYAAMPMVVVVYMACYVLGGIYQIMWRYAGVRDVARLCLLSAIACGVTLALNQFLTLGLFRGVLILIALMATIAVGGSRMIWRVCSKDRISGSLGDAMPVMVIGAGEAGAYAVNVCNKTRARWASPSFWWTTRRTSRAPHSECAGARHDEGHPKLVSAMAFAKSSWRFRRWARAGACRKSLNCAIRRTVTRACSPSRRIPTRARRNPRRSSAN
ncbi:MAG: hypothetical protein ACLR07_04095 [Christensenellales bacterium]